MLADDVEITLVTPGSADFVADAAAWTEIARQIVATRPDVILVHSVWVHIFAPLTSDIPIVFMGMVDPEHHKYIASVKRPGGNVTGALDPFFEIQEKRIALLSELRPAARRIALVWHSGGPYGERIEGAFKATAHRLGFEPCVVRVQGDRASARARTVRCRASPGFARCPPSAARVPRRDG
jgi:putative tryptophan/tyrosine transport system substrate-binding protein